MRKRSIPVAVLVQFQEMLTVIWKTTQSNGFSVARLRPLSFLYDFIEWNLRIFTYNYCNL